MRGSSIKKFKEDEALGPSSSNSSNLFKPKALRSSIGTGLPPAIGGDGVRAGAIISGFSVDKPQFDPSAYSKLNKMKSIYGVDSNTNDIPGLISKTNSFIGSMLVNPQTSLILPTQGNLSRENSAFQQAPQSGNKTSSSLVSAVHQFAESHILKRSSVGLSGNNLPLPMPLITQRSKSL